MEKYTIQYPCILQAGMRNHWQRKCVKMMGELLLKNHPGLRQTNVDMQNALQNMLSSQERDHGSKEAPITEQRWKVQKKAQGC